MQIGACAGSEIILFLLLSIFSPDDSKETMKTKAGVYRVRCLGKLGKITQHWLYSSQSRNIVQEQIPLFSTQMQLKVCLIGLDKSRF